MQGTYQSNERQYVIDILYITLKKNGFEQIAK